MAHELSKSLGDLFISSREKGEEGMPLLSVTLNDGLIKRETLVRRTDTNLSPSDHLLVREGDVAYNMMRVWQGALGRASCDGLVSPAYVVLRAKQGVDSEYAEHLFKTARMIYHFWAYSYGLTADRLRLYFKDFAKIPVNFPPFKEQQKIAKILSTWDDAIATTEQLLANSEQQKKALMQQLLTGKKRLPGFEEEWRHYSLSDVAKIIISPVDKKIIDGEKSVLLCNYKDVYYNTRIVRDMPFMHATATDAEIRKYKLEKSDVVITKDSETPGDIAVPALIAEDLNGVVCGYHLAILRPDKEMVDGAYLNYLLSMPRTRYYFFTLATGATRFGLSVGAIHGAELKLPPLSEQKAVAEVLAQCDKKIDALGGQLMSCKAEKKALMQQLLTGKRRVKLDGHQADLVSA